MIEYSSDEVMGLRNDLAQTRLDMTKLNNEIDMLKVDTSQVEKRVRVNMAKSLLGSKISDILDHTDPAWDEHKGLLRLSQEHLKWQCFLACSLSHMSKTIAALEVSLVKPLLDYLYAIIMSFRERFGVATHVITIHILYTRRIGDELSSMFLTFSTTDISRGNSLQPSPSFNPDIRLLFLNIFRTGIVNDNLLPLFRGFSFSLRENV